MKASDSRYRKCLYFSAGALSRKVEKLAKESWKKVKLSPSHAYLLMVVLDEPGIQPTILGEELVLAPSTITRLIEKLEEKKLVHRVTEGKTTSVHPTAKAKSMYPHLRQCLYDFYDKYCSILGKEESVRMVQAINRLTDKL
ncbi:MAG TPA: MarR family winged helix-turn-helix transcriptional regulator [Puia sp.]|nr:MarR family winged helix-turn-helix transcriptional regulator [Puia sp.]